MLDPPATARKGRGTEWVTDFAVLANCNKVVLSTTSRELVFGDTSTPNFKCQFRVQGKWRYKLSLASYPGPPFNFCSWRAWFAKIRHVTSLSTSMMGQYGHGDAYFHHSIVPECPWPK